MENNNPQIPICEYCGLPILDEQITRNKKHHSTCAYQKKMARSKACYSEMKSILSDLKKNDLILATLYEQFGPEPYLPVSLLLNADFNFGVKSFDFQDKNLTGIGIGQFGYFFFEDDTFQIFKK